MHFFDPDTLIQTIGILGVALIIFAESGILLGIFFPGDSLLFAAGILASQGLINLPLLIIACMIASILGDQVGYFTGRKFGPKIFSRPGSRFLTPDHIEKSHAFYATHGKKTIILARFTPIIRTLAPIIAGIGNMDYKTFVSYNIIGGVLWTVSMTLLGFFLGTFLPHAKEYVLPIIVGIVLISLIPSLKHLFSKRG